MTLFTSNNALHMTEHDAKFQATHLGQAHLAGTGPKGKTCRECVFYGAGLKVWPDYYEGGDLKNCLKQAGCSNPIPHKSKRRFPHLAASCALFEQNDNPPPVTRPDGGTKV